MSENSYNYYAEQALLGAMMVSAQQVRDTFLTVPIDAYYLQPHVAIASVMRHMIANDTPIDPITVVTALEESGDLHRVGGAPYIHTLMETPITAVNANHYASRINELYGRRLIYSAAQREIQRLDAAWQNPHHSDISNSSKCLTEAIEEANKYATGTTHVKPLDLETFLAEEDTYDWLVPGLLERGDRTVITGEEGLGKSELVSQIALCLSAGIHPFTGVPLGDGSYGIKVLIIDCENSPNQSRRRYRRIVNTINLARDTRGLPPVSWAKNLFIDFRSAGLNLTGSADAAYLESIVANTAPDLLVIGPLYRLHNANINDETAARELVQVLDNVRVRHGCALLTEAHAGHGEDGSGNRRMRPTGSSLFVRWPEFGFGLRKNRNNPEQIDVINWRGQREERAFPDGLVRGRDGLLPWRPTETYPAYQLPQNRF